MATTTVKKPTKPSKKQPPRRFVNIENAIILKQAGKSYKAIAEEMGTCPSNIHKQIAHLLPTTETEEFKRRRADIFANLQMQILSAVNAEDLKSASALQKITAAGILYDKERLETGKSTGNISLLIGQIEELQRASAENVSRET